MVPTRERLARECARLSSATYCLREWAEPGDDDADARNEWRRNTSAWDQPVTRNGEERGAPTPPTNRDLGRAVRRLREARALSLETLAGEAGMHPTYLFAIERGLRNPTWARLCGLARVLNIKIAALALAAEAVSYGAAYYPDPPHP
jgi:ribosome-binding protein aMBF1 (putative translation factor)